MSYSKPNSSSTEFCSQLDEVRRLRGQLSLKLLLSLDPLILEILHQTPFVTAYEMNSDEQWTRADIEGFLYIVSRSEPPFHSFLLINKKSKTHLIEHIGPDFEVKINGHFIFYRSNRTKKVLYGLWFFDEQECMATYEKMRDIIAELKQTKENGSINSEHLSGPFLQSCTLKDPVDNQIRESLRESMIESSDGREPPVRIKSGGQRNPFKNTCKASYKVSQGDSISGISFAMLRVAIQRSLGSEAFAELVWDNLRKLSEEANML